MIDPIDAAYIAAFVDGEGNIGIELSNHPTGSLKLQISNTHLGVLEWIQTLFPRGNIYQDKRKGKTKSKYYLLVYTGLNSKAIFEAITPYMKIKDVKGRIALDFINELERTKASSHRCLDDEMLEIRRDLIEAMRLDQLGFKLDGEKV